MTCGVDAEVVLLLVLLPTLLIMAPKLRSMLCLFLSLERWSVENGVRGPFCYELFP